MSKHFFGATATLIGMTIGAGILGLPYIIMKSGIIIGLLSIAILGAATLLINLYMGEISLRTKGNHQMIGLAEKYLGKKGKFIMSAAFIFAAYAALTAYIIGTGQTLSELLNISSFYGSILFFIIAGAIVFCGIKIFEKSEELFIAAEGLILLAILGLIWFSGKFNTSFFNTGFELKNIFLPYGAILFAFAGLPAIPEMKEELGKNAAQLKKAIIAGTLLCALVYLIFVIAVIGVTGSSTTEVAPIGLGEKMGGMMLLLGNIFAILTITTSFIGVGFSLKESFIFDYKREVNIAFVMAMLVPITIFLFGVRSFVTVISIGGAVAIGINSILVVIMHGRAKKLGNRKPEYEVKDIGLLSILLIAMFTAGLLYVFFF